MANVLPLDAQKRVARAYRARFVMALSAAIAALAVLLALSLVPSYLALSLAAPPVPAIAPGAMPDNDPRVIARAQALVAQFTPILSSTTSPSAIIATATAARPSGVLVHHVVYSAPISGKNAELLIVGTAQRERVAAYRDALSANPLFTNVTVPVSSLVGTGSGDFSITVGVTGIADTF